MRAARVPEALAEGERAETPSEIFLGGENRAVLRETSQDSRKISIIRDSPLGLLRVSYLRGQSLF